MYRNTFVQCRNIIRLVVILIACFDYLNHSIYFKITHIRLIFDIHDALNNSVLVLNIRNAAIILHVFQPFINDTRCQFSVLFPTRYTRNTYLYSI